MTIEQQITQAIQILERVLANLPPAQDTGAKDVTAIEDAQGTFLQDLSATVPLAADKPATTPETPSLEGISEITDADWLRYCRTILLAGWSVEKFKNTGPIKSVKFTSSETEILELMESLRVALLAEDVTVKQAESETWVSAIEKQVIQELAEKHSLK